MIGRIHAIKEYVVTISQEETCACFGCMHQECKDRPRFVMAKNSLHLPLSIGQMVEIETPKAMLLLQAFQVLFPPILGFIGGFMFTGFLFPLSGDPPRAAGGVLILFLAASLTYWFRKRFPSTAMPQVTQVCDL
jgi:sigma-E factor negative regulatory protein RseC